MSDSAQLAARSLDEVPSSRAVSDRQDLVRYAVYGGVFLLGIVAVFVFTSTGGPMAAPWGQGWMRWDARWYQQIWLKGYSASDYQLLVFPPAYSFLIGGLSKLSSGSLLETSIVLNVVALFATAALIAEWFSRKFCISPYLAFCFTLSAPTAYFTFTSYSDIVFMLLLWIVIWLAASDEYNHAAGVAAQCVLLFVLPWFRLTGYALASWLALRKRVAIAVLVSLALWLGFNRRLTHDPFWFLHAQQNFFEMPQGGFFQGLAFTLRWLIRTPVNSKPWMNIAALPLTYLVLLIAAGWWLARRKEWLLCTTLFSILILSHNQVIWRSAVRYDLPLVPLLAVPLLVASSSESGPKAALAKVGFYVLLVAQFGRQLHYAREFHSGYWAF